MAKTQAPARRFVKNLGFLKISFAEQKKRPDALAFAWHLEGIRWHLRGIWKGLLGIRHFTLPKSIGFFHTGRHPGLLPAGPIYNTKREERTGPGQKSCV